MAWQDTLPGRVMVLNLGERPLLLSKIRADGSLRRVNALVNAGRRACCPIAGEPGAVDLTLQIVLRFDMVVPRIVLALRHRASRHDPRHILGVRWCWSPCERQRRSGRPGCAWRPTALAGQGRVAEAAEWLERAMGLAERLPDNGALAQLLADLAGRELTRTESLVQRLL